MPLSVSEQIESLTREISLISKQCQQHWDRWDMDEYNESFRNLNHISVRLDKLKKRQPVPSVR